MSAEDLVATLKKLRRFAISATFNATPFRVAKNLLPTTMSQGCSNPGLKLANAFSVNPVRSAFSVVNLSLRSRRKHKAWGVSPRKDQPEFVVAREAGGRRYLQCSQSMPIPLSP